MFKASKVRYDAEKNIIIVDVGDMPSTVTDVEVPFPIVKTALPKMLSKAEEIAELQRMIHKIRKQKLLKIEAFVKEIDRISKGLEAARVKLKGANSKNEITKWRHVCAMWGKQKDVIKEMRYSIKLINEEDAKLEMKLLKIQTGK